MDELTDAQIETMATNLVNLITLADAMAEAWERHALHCVACHDCGWGDHCDRCWNLQRLHGKAVKVYRAARKPAEGEV